MNYPQSSSWKFRNLYLFILCKKFINEKTIIIPHIIEIKGNKKPKYDKSRENGDLVLLIDQGDENNITI